jgi:DNA-binding NarL/FixJ family response regulator
LLDRLQSLRLIKNTFLGKQVLMQTAFDDNDKIFTIIKNGASGYILKSDSADTILEAIVDIYNGGVVMNPTIAKKVLAHFTPTKNKNPLSVKENNVLELLAEGMSYKMIADNRALAQAL